METAAASRRALLAGLVAASAASGAGRVLAQPATSEILGAPTTSTILLARLIDTGALAQAAPGATLRLWHDPDELRAGVVSGRTRLFSTPTHVPANLANRGLPVKLLAVIGMGHLAVISADPAITRFSDLAGKKVLGFFRNDMPDLVFRACAKMEAMDPLKDIQLSYVGMPMEAAQMLASGRVQTAILSEPWATAAIMVAAQQGRQLHRAVELQDVWIKHTGHPIAMVGVGVDARLIEAFPHLPAQMHAGLAAARDWVSAEPAAAAALAQQRLQIMPAVFRASLAHAAITLQSAKAARGDLEVFYQRLLDLSPGVLGGRLPASDFYLDW